MARCDHLPIWKDAVSLAVLLEEAVQRFPRYHKYALGADLRRQAYAVCRGVVAANGERDGRAQAVKRLAVAVEQLKLLVQMGKGVKAFASFKEFEREADSGDRVVHHWLVPRPESWFEPVFIHDSYSNRKGKGTHAAVDRLQEFLQRAKCSGKRKAYFLQRDIANFFNNIDRGILYGLLRRRAEKIWQAAKRRYPDAQSGVVGGALAASSRPSAAKAAPTGNAAMARAEKTWAR
jgi:hypothetical protein